MVYKIKKVVPADHASDPRDRAVGYPWLSKIDYSSV